MNAFATTSTSIPQSTSLKQLFPNFKSYTAEELVQLTPEQLVSVLQDLSRMKDELSSQTIKLETQISAITQQIDQTLAAIKAEFQVSSLEELEDLSKTLLSDLEAQYAALAQSLNPSDI